MYALVSLCLFLSQSFAIVCLYDDMRVSTVFFLYIAVFFAPQREINGFLFFSFPLFFLYGFYLFCIFFSFDSPLYCFFLFFFCFAVFFIHFDFDCEGNIKLNLLLPLVSAWGCICVFESALCRCGRIYNVAGLIPFAVFFSVFCFVFYFFHSLV